MPEYATRLVGNVTNRWTSRGQEQEMSQLSANVSFYAKDGWRLHSIQPIPVVGGISREHQGVVLMATYERD